jgi:hypothetical protein
MHRDIVDKHSELWRLARRAYGRRFNQALYFQLCKLAARSFNRSVSFRSLYRDFKGTWINFLKNSKAMSEFDWCNTVLGLLEQEAKNNSGMRYYDDAEAVRNTRHYDLDLKRWFPKIKSQKDEILQRMVLLEVAKNLGIPPVQLFLDCGLVELSLLGRPM